MKREFSAGGVLVHVVDGRPVIAAIRPEGKPEGLWALPKGRIGKGEKPEATAVREVEEETGARGDARPEARRRPLRVHVEGRADLQGRQLLPASLRGGKLGDLAKEYAHEVADVQWLPLDEAPRLLAYTGERDMAREALAALGSEQI